MKNLINIENYEAFLLDYMEGNLSTEDTVALQMFAAQHPHLNIDLNDLELVELNAEEISFNAKENLKKPLLSDEQFVAYVENDLSAEEKQNIEKSFFIDPKGKPKTFLCGWASESEVGSIASIAVTHNAPIATHCNIEFEITENALVGKRINPSFPNDSKRWSQIVSIPISKHYYYEKAKDENGRDRNVFIENDSRSHWSARPFMKLELSQMKIHDWAYSIPGSGESQILSVEDIEWDEKLIF